MERVEMAERLGVYRCSVCGNMAEAIFDLTGANISAREFCNIHGLWEVKQNA
jgi:desulfoferrodoxin (superoxide reductase-like protein)